MVIVLLLLVKLVQNMQKDMLNNLLLVSIFLFCLSCSNEQKGNTTDTLKSDTINVAEKVLENIICCDSLIQKFKVKSVFDKNSQSLFLEYAFNKQVKKMNIGRYSNTFGDAPNVDITQIDKRNGGIVITTNFLQLGQSSYELYFFSFNLFEERLSKLCEFSDIAIHDMQQDTLSNIQYFDYEVKMKDKKFILKEYAPYKSLNVESKYTIKTSECNY